MRFIRHTKINKIKSNFNHKNENSQLYRYVIVLRVAALTTRFVHNRWCTLISSCSHCQWSSRCQFVVAVGPDSSMLVAVNPNTIYSPVSMCR